MKKTLLFASAAVLLCGCGTGSKYVVEGHIAGLEGTVYMFEGDSLIDSAVVEGGKFRFEGPADITARRTVTDSREGDAQRFGTMFFPEPGTVSIEDNPDAPAGSTRVTGTPANDASSAFRASAMTLMDEYHREGTSEGRRREIEDELGGLPRKTAEANRDNAFGIMALEGMAPTLSGQELLDRIVEQIGEVGPEVECVIDGVSVCAEGAAECRTAPAAGQAVARGLAADGGVQRSEL